MTNLIKLSPKASKKLKDIIDCKCHCHNLCPGAYGGQEIGDAKAACLCFPMECKHCKGKPYPLAGSRNNYATTYKCELHQCKNCAAIIAVDQPASRDEFGELRVYTETDMQYHLDMQKKELLQTALDNGHGGGNWRRLIIMMMAKEENWVEKLRDAFNRNRHKKINHE